MRALGKAASMVVPLSLLAAACAMGTNLRTSDVATEPVGATMRVDWHGEDGGYWEREAELVLVADSGFYLLHPPNLVFYPMGSPATLRPRRAPGAPMVELDDPDPDAIAQLARYARHPYGLDPTQIRRLLDALGREEAVVRRSP